MEIQRSGYQRPGGPPQFAEEGQTLVFPAGDPHKFWNAGEGELRCTGYVKPAHNLEYFLSAIYDSQKRSGGTRPDPFEAAFLMLRYRSEFGMLKVPSVVQHFIFPMQMAVGRMLGKYDRYADAPAPIRQ